MTKREILTLICEEPGWAPSGESSQKETTINELIAEGWITSGLDGYHATAKALEGYPAFLAQDDIADPEAGRAEPVSDAVKHPAIIEHALPSMSIADAQRVEVAIQIGELKGAIALTKSGLGGTRRNVQVILRITEESTEG